MEIPICQMKYENREIFKCSVNVTQPPIEIYQNNSSTPPRYSKIILPMNAAMMLQYSHADGFP